MGVAPRPGSGLDIVAYTDPLGATGPRIKVQVKRRQDKTAVDGVRSFLAVLGAHDVGLFISAGGFTSDAEREVRSQGNRRITLIDLCRVSRFLAVRLVEDGPADRGGG